MYIMPTTKMLNSASSKFDLKWWYLARKENPTHDLKSVCHIPKEINMI